MALVAPIVAVCIVALIAVSSLAVDIAHFYVARNELQNAADAGALAGAGVLLNADGTVNSNANTIAYNAATQNNSENSSVEVLDYVSNAGDVQRGHWTFASIQFRRRRLIRRHTTAQANTIWLAKVISLISTVTRLL